MPEHVHNWQQIEVNKPKLHDASREALIDFITAPYIVTRKLLCTRCAELKTIVEPDPTQVLLKGVSNAQEKS